jgi:hypothetical protein
MNDKNYAGPAIPVLIRLLRGLSGTTAVDGLDASVLQISLAAVRSELPCFQEIADTYKEMRAAKPENKKLYIAKLEGICFGIAGAFLYPYFAGNISVKGIDTAKTRSLIVLLGQLSEFLTMKEGQLVPDSNLPFEKLLAIIPAFNHMLSKDRKAVLISDIIGALPPEALSHKLMLAEAINRVGMAARFKDYLKVTLDSATKRIRSAGTAVLSDTDIILIASLIKILHPDGRLDEALEKELYSRAENMERKTLAALLFNTNLASHIGTNEFPLLDNMLGSPEEQEKLLDASDPANYHALRRVYSRMNIAADVVISRQSVAAAWTANALPNIVSTGAESNTPAVAESISIIVESLLEGNAGLIEHMKNGAEQGFIEAAGQILTAG